MGNSHPNQIKAGRGLIDVEKVITYRVKYLDNGCKFLINQNEHFSKLKKLFLG